MKDNAREKLIKFICKDYIQNIKYNGEDEDWFYVVEKAFNLHKRSLGELRNFRQEITDYNK